jgi:SAM-dependent methyltransferase
VSPARSASKPATPFSRRVGRLAQGALRRAPAPLRGVLGRAAWRGYERYLSLRVGRHSGRAPDGFPVPPPRLRVLVARRSSVTAFLESGAMEAEAIRELVARHGSPIDEMGSVLDFGCGCGRIARHWAGLEEGRVFGCDHNRDLVLWCRHNLPFIDARVNAALPPFPFDRRFELIYAVSLFTHLSESAQRAWIDECRRALAPNGILLFTTLGDRYVDRLSASERRAFERGEVVTRFREGEGSNLCVTYHPEAFLGRLLDGFERLESITAGVAGVSTDSPLTHQDVHLARKLQ